MADPSPGPVDRPEPVRGPTGLPWAHRSLAELLAEHDLTGAVETPFPNDGWSGAALTLLEGGGRRYVLKRTSWSMDWIARSTRDHALREAVLAAASVPFKPSASAKRPTESAPRLRSPSITSFKKLGERNPASFENRRNEKFGFVRFAAS